VPVLVKILYRGIGSLHRRNGFNVARRPTVPIRLIRVGRIDYTTQRVDQFEHLPEERIAEVRESETALSGQNTAGPLPKADLYPYALQCSC